jgi:uncharacterized damage-inducible protein DinB
MNNEIFVKMALEGWYSQVKATNSIFDKLSDEQLLQEIAPSRNRGVYLLGHLAAVHDLMLSLLRFEEAIYPELHPIFIQSPDKTVGHLPPTEQLRAQWAAVNEKLAAHFESLPPEEWFTRHANITQEDFEKEPHRNRLNVLLVRTNHLSNHRGQLALLVPKG